MGMQGDTGGARCYCTVILALLLLKPGESLEYWVSRRDTSEGQLA